MKLMSTSKSLTYVVGSNAYIKEVMKLLYFKKRKQQEETMKHVTHVWACMYPNGKGVGVRICDGEPYITSPPNAYRFDDEQDARDYAKEFKGHGIEAKRITITVEYE